AAAAAAAIEMGIRRVWPNAETRLCPMADGGEGTLDAVLSGRGQRDSVRVAGASGAPVEAGYGLLDGSFIAVIESAQVVSLTDPIGTAIDVEMRSTRGIGELMLRLLDAGARRFMIGLGGSSTNDGGAGLLAALGFALTSADGTVVEPTPAGLATLAAVHAEGLDPRLSASRITIMSDVTNPLCGPHGATAIFGPQKGVRADRIATVDERIAHFATLAEGAVGRNAQDLPGAGAAGGLGFALQLLGGEPRSGAEVVADLVGLDAALDDADWLITGEGHSDAQTLQGKTPLVVARHATAQNVPATLISGGIDPAALPELGRHFAGCFALPAGPATLEQCVAHATTLLADRAEQAARLWSAARGLVARMVS
ncbi:MAG: glycerate kinase, partial [Casimicrobiaceae bacterium]